MAYSWVARGLILFPTLIRASAHAMCALLLNLAPWANATTDFRANLPLPSAIAELSTGTPLDCSRKLHDLTAAFWNGEMSDRLSRSFFRPEFALYPNTRGWLRSGHYLRSA